MQPTDLTINHAKTVSEENHQDMVIIVGITSPGRLCVVSYGKDKKHCSVAAIVSKLIYHAVTAFFARASTAYMVEEQRKKGTSGNG